MTMNRNSKKTLFCLITTMIAFLGLGVWASKAETPKKSIPQGVFKLSGRPAVYYSNGEGAYMKEGSLNPGLLLRCCRAL